MGLFVEKQIKSGVIGRMLNLIWIVRAPNSSYLSRINLNSRHLSRFIVKNLNELYLCAKSC